MKLAVVSPHLDDAIFSLGEHLVGSKATIVCPMAGVPRDDAGRAKYERLLAEHDAVCTKMDLFYVNGPYYDDVYSATRNIQGLAAWLYDTLKMCEATEVWAPLGIHHPDHDLVAGAALEAAGLRNTSLAVYEELPYRVLYPEVVARIGLSDVVGVTLQGYTPHLALKKEMCRMYASQIGDEIERCLYVPERLWGVR